MTQVCSIATRKRYTIGHSCAKAGGAVATS